MDATFDSLFYDQGELIGGIDESGVVDIAGPLVAACVVLPKIDLQRDNLRIFEVNDCKQIPERYRKQYAELIYETALGIGIGEVIPAEIDYMGMGHSIRLAMMRAVAACQSPTEPRTPCIPDFLLIDGEQSNRIDIPINQKTIPKGDTKSLCVAAASIVAKVYRDEVMTKLSEAHPEFDWQSNRGHHCENQFEGMDQSGFILGVHRIESRILLAPKLKERRSNWKRTTIQQFYDSARKQICSLKK